jgi:N-acylglucosamine 2-epimerase (GlcNAc 2-epimerase)
MHLCEALLAAFDATGETRYLVRAERLADHICIRQAALADGLVWEHYRADWSVDWDYNKDDKSNIFRPWGFQPGHLTEWAKLLLLLDQRRPRADHLPRARLFFDTAMAKSWDAQHGGLFYGFAPDGSVCDSDKYFWVQAESLATAARPGPACPARRNKPPWCGNPPMGLRLAAFRGPPTRRLVAHPARRQHEDQRSKKPRRQGGLPHHGGLLRRAGHAGPGRAADARAGLTLPATH